MTHGKSKNEKFLIEFLETLVGKNCVIIDASTIEANADLLRFAEKTKESRKFLICTTGLNEAVVAKWQRAASKHGHAVLVAPNTSVGILLVRQMLTSFGPALAQTGFTPAIFEIHHGQKKDSPSGTAKSIQKAVKASMNADAPISAIRGGGNFGEHTVLLMSEGEEIRVEHRALSRALFGTGAIRLAKWLSRQKPGHYELDDVAIDEL